MLETWDSTRGTNRELFGIASCQQPACRLRNPNVERRIFENRWSLRHASTLDWQTSMLPHANIMLPTMSSFSCSCSIIIIVSTQGTTTTTTTSPWMWTRNWRLVVILFHCKSRSDFAECQLSLLSIVQQCTCTLHIQWSAYSQLCVNLKQREKWPQHHANKSNDDDDDDDVAAGWYIPTTHISLFRLEFTQQ